MKAIPRWTTLLILVFLFALGAACADGDDDDNDDNDNPADDDAGHGDDDSTPVDAVSSASPGVKKALLTEDHQGWNHADCRSCHADAHDRGYVGGECSSCHGSNGAPWRSAGHDNDSCSECHAQSHPETAFRSPVDCRLCHGYEPVSESECASTESFDVVVIGAGGGGLAAAAKLSRQGLSVAVLEQNFRIGGCMGMIRRGDYSMEIGLHALDGLDAPDGTNRHTFEELGILSKLKLVKLDPMYVASYPNHQIVVPADVEAYRQVLKENFPAETTKIDLLFNDLADYDLVFTAINNLTSRIALKDLITIVTHGQSALRLFGLKNQTLAEFMAEYGLSQELAAVWAQLSSFLGVEPGRLSALMFVVMWNSYHHHGYYYFEGGSGAVANALVRVIEENGGTIRLGARATKIDIVDGRATLVRTADDGCYAARYVVSNANAIATVNDLVGAEHFPADYLSSMENMTVGLSTFTVYLGLDHDFGRFIGGSHEVMFSDTYDTDTNLGYIANGDIEHAPGAVGNYSAVDPLAAPAGKNSIQLITQLPYDWENDWRWNQSYEDYVDLKTEIAWRLIERAEKYLPGLSDHIEVMEVGTPRTVEAYTLNPRGSIFGWEHTIEQSLDFRLPNETPIPNLYLAGAWTFPGAGQSAVILSGSMVADMIIKQETQ